jgi:hypothetical protein
MTEVRIGRSQRVVVADSVHARMFDDELIVLDLGEGEYYSLDPIGSLAWDGFSEGKCAEEIAGKIAAEYDVEFDRALQDLLDLASDLVAKGLFRIQTAPADA